MKNDFSMRFFAMLGLAMGIFASTASAQVNDIRGLPDEIIAYAAQRATTQKLTPEMTFRIAGNEPGSLNALTKTVVIHAEGAINPDTPKKYLEFLVANELFPSVWSRTPDGHSFGASYNIALHLTSGGGDVGGGLLLGQVVQYMETTTVIDGYCASSCTYIFMGGHERYYRDGQFLVHRAATMGPEKDGKRVMQELDAQNSIEITARLARYLNKAGVDLSYLFMMAQQSPDEMWWVSYDQALQANISNNGMVKSTARILPNGEGKNAAILSVGSTADYGYRVDVGCSTRGNYPVRADFVQPKFDFALTPRGRALIRADALPRAWDYLERGRKSSATFVVSPLSPDEVQKLEIKKFLASAIHPKKVWRDPKWVNDRPDYMSYVSWDFDLSHDQLRKLIGSGAIYFYQTHTIMLPSFGGAPDYKEERMVLVEKASFTQDRAIEETFTAHCRLKDNWLSF